MSAGNDILISIIKIQAKLLRGRDYRTHVIRQQGQQTDTAIDQNIFHKGKKCFMLLSAEQQ